MTELVYARSVTTTPNPDPIPAEALARALAYSDAVGLSDGTDRPATTVDEVLEAEEVPA